MLNEKTSQLARIIWDYMKLTQPIIDADLLFILGSHDLRVPEYAATLYRKGRAPRLIVSGGMAHHDDLLKTGWEKTEAELFRDVMIEHGVPDDRIFIETKARNTGENFSLSKSVLDKNAITFDRVLVVTKPYMERRAFATGKKQWPDKELIVTSPPIAFDDYLSHNVNGDTTPEGVINIMMGDLQRIEMYGKNGFQIPQEIPEYVRDAWRQLKRLGYTQHLLPDAEL